MELRCLLHKIYFLQIFCMILLMPNIGFGQTPKQSDVRQLSPNQKIERELTEKETHNYKFELNKNEFLQIRGEHKGTDIVLKLFDANGKLLTEMVSPNGVNEFIFSFIAVDGGVHTVAVSIAKDFFSAKKCPYTIFRENPRVATQKDQKRLQIESEIKILKNEIQKLSDQQATEAKQILVEKFVRGCESYQEIDDKQNEAKCFSHLAFYSLEFNQEALKKTHIFHNRALSLYQEIGDKKGEASEFVKIGITYGMEDNIPKQVEYLNKALHIFQSIGDKSKEFHTNSLLGFTYSILNNKQKALSYYSDALSAFKKIENANKFEEIELLNTISKLYDDLGDKQKSLDYSNQAKILSENLLPKSINDSSLEVFELIDIAFEYSRSGEKQKAFEYLDKVLSLSKNTPFEPAALEITADAYSRLGEKQKALEFYNQALSLAKSKNEKSMEGSILESISLTYYESGEAQKALEYMNRAMPLLASIGFNFAKAKRFASLMFIWKSLGNNRLATFYGKQSVSNYQEVRKSVASLDKETQEGYLKKFENTYRKLADILIIEGRLFEAQQVLAMLKEDEYFDYVRRDANEIKKLSLRADLRADERAALEKYESLAGKVTEYGTQFTKLEDLKQQQGADFKQQTEFDDLKAKLDAANAAFRIFLEKELVAELGKPVKREIEIDRALQTKLQQWGNGTVALYTVAGDERYRVILTTPKTQTDGKTEIKITDLNKKIFEFRAALQNPAVDPRSLGKELYDILIKPVEKDLAAAEAKTLLWSLDGTLRYIPIAALSPDGKTYLAEKYQTVVITSTTRQSLLAETDPNWRLLGAGVTKASKLVEPNGTGEIAFSALPGVQSELVKIVSDEEAKARETGLLSGRRLIDESFNLPALESGMSQRAADQKRKYNVIHLATHFRLGGDTAKSFLLLGGNQALTLEKVSDNTALNFGDVELVTLSACNTGFGTAVENKTASREQERKILEENNGVEVDSLATFIELRGAKAVLASLWAVADESTGALMSEFYRLRKENPQVTKSEAMRQAQLSMIQGRFKPSGGSADCRSEVINLDGTKQPPFKCDANALYSHPYFWSPFVLIGNWR